jgi:hypothetical protein
MPELRIFRHLKGSPVDNGSERFSIVGGNQSKGSEIKPQQKGLGFKLRRLTAFKVCNILSRYPPPTHTPTPTHTHTHTHTLGGSRVFKLGGLRENSASLKTQDEADAPASPSQVYNSNIFVNCIHDRVPGTRQIAGMGENISFFNVPEASQKTLCVCIIRQIWGACLKAIP